MILNEEWTLRWIQALRSDKYRQGRGQLCHEDQICVKRYCCLGVLCDIVSPNLWEHKQYSDGSISYTHLGMISTPNDTIVDMIGISSDRVGVLVNMNDTCHASFNTIADQIQQWLNEDISGADVIRSETT